MLTASRFMLAALGFTVLSTLTVTCAHAQSDQAKELKRRALSGEAENGLCGGVSWPGLTREAYVGWLERVTVGAYKVNKFAKSCQYDVVTDISTESGAKCVTYTWHNCSFGGTCGHGVSRECRRNGDWTRKEM